MTHPTLLFVFATFSYIGCGQAFLSNTVKPIGSLRQNGSFGIVVDNSKPTITTRSSSSLSSKLFMAKSNSGGKKKRRRRKNMPVPTDQIPGTTSTTDEPTMSIEELQAIAKFQPSKGGTSSTPGGETTSSSKTILASDLTDLGSPEKSEEALIDLPDIRDALRQKELKKIEEEINDQTERQRPRISRKDKKAFLQLLEEQPFADADDSYFEEEKYGTVSALLAEKAKPFLGIPPGPLQVGHFIGSLVIILMAFVEYPGFPLTNLPTPLRECFQGGLATVYSINIVVAVFAALKAPERGQSSILWAAKAFSVGGLALDQLTQLPTTKEMQASKK